MKSILIFIGLIWLNGHQSSFAQNQKITITGQLKKTNTISPENLLVFLYAKENEQLIKTEATDQTGKFIFENISPGRYYVTVEENGKTLHNGASFNATSDYAIPEIELAISSESLKEVVITTSKKFIERQDGKMIMNVDSAIGSSGSTAFELLEKAPSVAIDNNDNISLRGKSGIQIQIDGKPTQMSGSNLADYLRGIPAESIDKIEFITNPGSKYDAAGTAIINIKMKKSKRKGSNGSISLSNGAGRYFKNGNNISLNHRTEKWNVFGNYGFAYREGFNDLRLDRKFYEDNAFTGAYDQNNFLKIQLRNHTGRFGVDYLVNEKHSFSLLANVVNNKFNPTGSNVSDVYDNTNTLASSFETKNKANNQWKNYAVNLNHKVKIDTLGTELNTDFDWANYGNRNDQDFTTRYYDLDGAEFQNPYILEGNIKGDLNIIGLKTDFTTTFKNKVKLESGLKSTYVKSDNELTFYDWSSGSPVLDETKSNHFIYKENINAAYLIASKEFGKWKTNLGLRVENTNIDGEQRVGDQSFKNNYTQLFPSAFVGYNISEKHSLEFNYSRRITRPSYDQLNPFKFFLDPTTYEEGNPYLSPQTTNSFELTHVLNKKVYTTLSYSQTANNITQVIMPSEGNNQQTVQTNKNLNTVTTWGLNAIVPFEITKWWTNNNSLNFNLNSFSGNISGTALNSQSNFAYDFNTTNNFKFGNGYSGELSANYRSSQVYAFLDLKPVWFLNLGVQKKFEKATLRLAVNDLFFTNNIKASNTFTNYTERFAVSRDSRNVMLTFTYNFGNGNSQPRRTGGAEDIKQRAGNANG